MVFLKILLVTTAVVVAAVVFLAVAVLVAIRVWFTLKLKQLGSDLAGLTNPADALPTPELTLRPAPVDLLDGSPEAKAAIESLQQLGFSHVRCYTLDQPEGTRGAGLVDTARHAYAAVFDVPGHGLLVDLLTPYADGTYMTYSNSHPTGLDRPPGMPIVRFTGATPEELADQFFAHRPPGPFAQVSAEQFQTTLENYHQAEMTWRLSNLRAAQSSEDE